MKSEVFAAVAVLVGWMTPLAAQAEGNQMFYSSSAEARAFFALSAAERATYGTNDEQKIEGEQSAGGVPLSWQDSAARPHFVTVKRISDGRTFLWTQLDKGTSLRVQNLEIGFDYEWTAMDHCAKPLGGGRFTVADVPPRVMEVPFVKNMRDLGGWKGLGGKRVRQGRIYRSAWFDNAARFKSGKNYAITFSNAPLTEDEKTNYVAGVSVLRDSSRRILVNQLGLRTDLDIRSPHETHGLPCSPVGEAITFAKCPMLAYGSMKGEDGKRAFAAAFRVLLDERNYPVDFHCAGGKDRTGTLAFFANGLLGVSLEDLKRDYEFTVLGTSRKNINWHRDGMFVKLVEAVEACEGATLTEKFESYFKSCGFTDEDIAKFRAQMLE